MIFGATSYKDTKFGIVPRNKLVKLEIEGVAKGLEFVRSISKDPDIKITPELIKMIHRKSFGWIFPKWAGKFRIINVVFSGKEALEYYKVNGEIINLCLDLQERVKHLPKKTIHDYIDKVVKLLAWFQHRFVQIHPFNDYNGRTARLLTTLLLVKFRLPSVEIKSTTKKDRKIYITALQKADDGDYSDLENLISDSLNEGLERYSL